jgi:hypothetical protein
MPRNGPKSWVDDITSEKLAWLFGGTLLGSSLLFLSSFWFNFTLWPNRDLAGWGQFGDFFSGTIGTVLSALTLIAVGLTFWSQRKELAFRKLEIKLEKIEELHQSIILASNECKRLRLQAEQSLKTGDTSGISISPDEIIKIKSIVDLYFWEDRCLVDGSDLFMDFVSQCYAQVYLPNGQRYGDDYVDLSQVAGETAVRRYSNLKKASEAMHQRCFELSREIMSF